MLQTAYKPPSQAATANEIPPIVLKLSPLIELTEEQFAQFCGLNRDLRIERAANGELEIMAPAFSETGNRNIKITTQLENWAERDGAGRAFGPPAGFTLPNGAVREPDASWISRSRLTALSPEARKGFYHICPDFVVELRSDTDRLIILREKMEEYIENGARLGLLIDPQNRRVYIYRPGTEVETLDNPDRVSGEPVLPEFILDLRAVWDPWFRLSAENSE